MDDNALEANAQDNSWRHQRPAAVALPASIEQVQALVRAYRAHGVALVARATGTTGAAVPLPDSIVLSFTRMDRIVAIRAGDRCAVVQPGVLNGALQQALARMAVLGAGPVQRGDLQRGWQPGLQCRWPTRGEVRHQPRQRAGSGGGDRHRRGDPLRWCLHKDSTGYDLTHLLVGSEGWR